MNDEPKQTPRRLPPAGRPAALDDGTGEVGPSAEGSARGAEGARGGGEVLTFCRACGFDGAGAYCSNCGRRHRVRKPRKPLPRPTSRSLLVAAAVCLIVTILAIVGVPHIPWVADSLKRKQTEKNLRIADLTLDCYYEVNNAWPVSKEWRDATWLIPLVRCPGLYTPVFPVTDGWGRPLRYRSNGKIYALCSLGKDGLPDVARAGEPASSFDADICLDQYSLAKRLEDSGWERHP